MMGQKAIPIPTLSPSSQGVFSGTHAAAGERGDPPTT